jgi:chromate transporter
MAEDRCVSGSATTTVATLASAAEPLLTLGPMDWLRLFAYYLSLSFLAVGGVIATTPDMHRYLVERNAWLTDPQFSASITIAQAAPGPNVLFVALLGWHVGINAGGAGPAGWLLGAMGMALCMLGVMLPSSVLTWMATRWGHRNRERRAVRAFKQGMAPVVIGLLLATAWVLARAHGEPALDWPLWLVTAITMLLVWRTRLHLLWMLGTGAVLGALGLV